jgi:NAD(P)-dependent dehydrogenase (short-subunit alcohol dehydrogenase family)
VNVNGVFYCMKYEIEVMLQRGCGAIVNNSSLLGLKGTPNFALYVASKHAVCGLTKSAALEYAEHGIRINAVAPGPIETRMLAEISGGDVQQFAKYVPMKRIGRPEEIADAVLWLFSEQSSFITGQVISVDGGWAAK